MSVITKLIKMSSLIEVVKARNRLSGLCKINPRSTGIKPRTAKPLIWLCSTIVICLFSSRLSDITEECCPNQSGTDP